MITARDVMNTSLLSVEKGTSMSQAAKVMTGQHVGSIIVTAGNYPIGIVTETDITKAIAHGKNPQTLPIEDIMSSPLFSTAPETDLVQIANIMSSNRIKKMPVIEHGRVIGMITQTDIIKHVLRVCSGFTDQYKQGTANNQTMQSFMTCSADIYNSLKGGLEYSKHWHMRCKHCNYRFMTEEVAGKLQHAACPQCGGAIEYDPAPPV